ncbi:TPA: hypothetical protein ACV09P_001756 [Campylobacter jejuni]
MFTGGGGIRKSHLNSKKIILSLATISFLASCANAAPTPEIKTYDEISKNTKASSASVYSPRSPINTTVSNSQSNPISITGDDSYSITIEKGGTLGNAGNTDDIIKVQNYYNALTLVDLTNNGTIKSTGNIEPSNTNTGNLSSSGISLNDSASGAIGTIKKIQ